MKTPILSLAGLALVSCLAAPASAQPVPQLAYVQPLPSNAVLAVQERLRNAGAYAGMVDGVWGPDSVSALQRYQSTHQLQVTGQMNQATAATLGLDPAMLLGAPLPAVAVVPPSSDQLTTASVRAIQGRLRTLGFYGGAVDGVWGQSTEASIERFQQGRGIQPNGQLNPPTLTALGVAPETLAYR